MPQNRGNPDYSTRDKGEIWCSTMNKAKALGFFFTLFLSFFLRRLKAWSYFLLQEIPCTGTDGNMWLTFLQPGD